MRYCICESGPFQTDNSYNQHRSSCAEVIDQRKRASENIAHNLKSRKSFSRSRQRTTASSLLRDSASISRASESFGELREPDRDSDVDSFSNNRDPTQSHGSTAANQVSPVGASEPSAAGTSQNSPEAEHLPLGFSRSSRGRISKPSRKQIETNEYLERESLRRKEPQTLRPEDSRLPVPPQLVNLEETLIRSKANVFGLFKVFQQLPSHDPDETLSLDDRTGGLGNDFSFVNSSNQEIGYPTPSSFFPYPNENAFLLGEWFYASSKQKSIADFQKLRRIVGREDFRPDDIRHADWKTIHTRLGFIHGDTPQVNKRAARRLSDEARQEWDQLRSNIERLNLDASWRRSSVSISLRFPMESDGRSKSAINRSKKRKMYSDVLPPFPALEPTVSQSKSGMFTYTFHDFYHRSIMEVIRDKVANRNSCRNFHFLPYHLRWRKKSIPDHFDDKPLNDDFRPQDRSDANFTPDHSETSDSPGLSKGNLPRSSEFAEHDVFGEFFSSAKFRQAYEEIQMKHGPSSIEIVIVALMFSSDVTHLTSCGDAEVWPLYMFFLNDSKYERAKPNENLCEPLAYFNKLPDSFKDFVYGIYSQSGKRHAPSTTNKFFAHASKEFTHAQWRKLLTDPDFLEAYEHGKILRCWDDIDRLFYPRAFIYSADYKEKALMATIRSSGICPCPECLIKKTDMKNMGTREDEAFRVSNPRKDDSLRQNKISKARHLINKEGQNVDSTGVENLLKEESLVPVENAFTILSDLDKKFNLFAMFLPDLLHEFLLGVWMTIFIHLLRLLIAIGGDALLAELDRRYRCMPTFGRDKVRKFRKNVSRLTHFAARDYEDLLQCAIPAFDGLIPEPYSASVTRLLYLLAYWYSLANLRLHTRPTVELLKKVTSEMSTEVRTFSEGICERYDTKELESEAQKRERKEKRQEDKKVNGSEASGKRKADSGGKAAQKRKKVNDGSFQVNLQTVPEKPKTRKKKKFSFDTYKWHRLGDYARTIEEYGTTDSYTTALGEHEHKKPKSYYSRTNKKDFIRQFVRIERRQARTRAIRERRQPLIPPTSQFDDDTSLDPSSAYHISKYSRQALYLGAFLQTNKDDPAIENFMVKLRSHLLPRVRATHLELARQSQCEYSDCIPLLLPEALNPGDSLRVFIEGDKLFPHPIIKINYTSYDVRRDQDVLSPHTSHCNLMVLANSGPTNYWYAKLLGIYHLFVTYLGPGSVDRYARRFDVLWVRWYQTVDYPVSWSDGRLESVKLGDEKSPTSFGFIDPCSVLRACHIGPNFCQGIVSDCKSSIGYGSEEYKRYYVLRFSDRDISMRYEWGHAVGHTYAHSNPSRAVQSEDKDQELSETENSNNIQYPEEADSMQQTSQLTAIDEVEDSDSEELETSKYISGGYSSSDDEDSSDDDNGGSDSDEVESEDEQDVIERMDHDDMYG